MAQPATTPKIEELRFRLKTDAKSRLFYPLAEELRKVGQFAEAEQVLRTGLVHHPTYLSAWVSLGRVSRDLKNHQAAVEALNKAMLLDPGNVVAARLLADSYIALGEKLEALKKYKLVHALLPSDEELEAMIERLDNELNPITIAPVPEPEPEPQPEPEPLAAQTEPTQAPERSQWGAGAPAGAEPPENAGEGAGTPLALPSTQEMPWGDTGDAEPMHVAHDESPFEEPVADYSSAALEVESPEGIHIARAPLTADLPMTIEGEETLPAPEAVPIAPEEDITNTLTMADLYARQGLTDDARHIYESILQRDPDNASVREKLEALSPPPPAPPAPAPAPEPARNNKVARLESWLTKVSRREVSRV
jgi:tetratricopeptide (TPR) repeat protein